MDSIGRRLAALRPGRSNQPTANELDVARALLAGSDERLGKLMRQLEQAPVERTSPSPDSVRITPRWTTTDLDFDFDVDQFPSDWLTVRDGASGRQLNFRVVVGRHGFLSALEGKTVDGGRWPAGWRPHESLAHTGARQYLQLPSVAELLAERAAGITRFGEWLGDAGLVAAAANELRIYPPASSVAIGELELRTASRLPASLREFLAVSDGIDVGPLHVLGTADAYSLDIPGREGLVIALEPAGLDDEAIVVSRHEGDETVYSVAVHDTAARLVPRAADIRGFVSDLLRRRLRGDP